MTAPNGWVWLARIKRTQGRKGEVFAEILTDFIEKFAERRHLWLLRETANPAVELKKSGPPMSPREVELVHHWLHKGGVVLHFAGVDSISAGEELAGLIVGIPQSERAILEDGSFYIGDLIGCVLVDIAQVNPQVVGEIEDVDRTAGPTPILVVRGATSEEILIPFAKDYLRRVDAEAKRVEMALPEGLLNLNSGSSG
jgi:16S rRNA processing protein RimM